VQPARYHLVALKMKGAIPALATLLLCGCGYIGEPLPPLMNIPARPGDLIAVQRGARILAHFTIPAITTEGTVIKKPVTPELRIGPKPAGQFNPGAWAATATPAGQPAVENSVAQFEIPVASWIGRDVALAAKVTGANGRDAGWSAPVFLSVVPPPDQPAGLRAEAVPQGVRLTWRASGNLFAVFRRDPDQKDYAPLARSTNPEWIDTTAQWGKLYSYLVQSLAKAGEGEAQSDLSSEIAITPLDTFPPAAPVGLTVVPSTTSIELVWERNPEPAVTGYRVYRALANGPLAPLADTREIPNYSDRQIESGKVYRYAVAALKSNGKEGPMSTPVEVSAP